MTSFSDLIAQGASHAWLFIPSAILLGILHGLEPGHSKTMMAAFIIAIRGTIGQAILLAVCATISHTAIVWIVALGGLYLWQGVDSATLEPYFQIASGVMIVLIALWMLSQYWRERAHAHAHERGHHHHGHDHDHAHGHAHTHADNDLHRLEVTAGYQDAHELAHARDIERRFSGKAVATGQIVLFGLSGGLIPCGAAITVLILCLQLQQISLGIVLVLCFSVGLALTMTASGVIAAVSVRAVSKRWSGFGAFAQQAPFVSGLLVLLMGLYIGASGWMSLPA